MTNTEKELSILFLSTSYMKMYLDMVVKTDKDIKIYEPVFKILNKQGKMCKVFSKKVISVLKTATDIFEEIETEAKKVKTPKRFEKKLRFNEDKELEVNGLVFAICLIMEHRNLNKRVLVLDYKLANDIYKTFEVLDSKIISNAKVASKQFLERIKGL